ncbi:MAG TPA: sensor domain-containing diguanylate cyclase [Magnetospirillaceae bacterium]
MTNNSTAELSDRARAIRHVVVSVALILLIVGIQVQALRQSRADVEDRTRLAAQNLGSVLGTSMVGAFQNIDLLLQTVADQTRLHPQWAEARDPTFVDILESLVHRTPGLLGLHVTDASGKVLYGTGKINADNVNIADRKYFQQLRDDPNAGMAISSPVLGYIIKKWVLVCARRIELPNGQFGGVVYGSIEIEGMAERVTGRPLQLGSQDVFSMSDNDMTIIVRYADHGQDMQFVGQRRPVPHVAEFLRSGVEDGFFTTNSPFDHVDRIIYFQRIPGRAMHLIVGLATDQVLAGWRRSVVYAGVLTLIFALLISIGSYLIYQEQRRTLRLVVELAASNQKLSDLSTIDALTGIANRRRFDELLEEEWRRASRNRQSLAVAMMDVDFFKPYNDQYGHQRGDECLRQVGQVLKQHIRRAGDFVARYGGEEFVIVCAATDGAHARRLVEDIRVALESLALPHAFSPFGHVTASFGVAAIMPDDTLTSDTLVKQADEALYVAKDGGRNRVVLTA